MIKFAFVGFSIRRPKLIVAVAVVLMMLLFLAQLPRIKIGSIENYVIS